MTPAAFGFLQAELGIRNLVNVRVDHCPFAFAAVIDAVAGWRLVYSGDTRPCERLVQVRRRKQAREVCVWGKGGGRLLLFSVSLGSVCVLPLCLAALT
jgi:hypothetical protein